MSFKSENFEFVEDRPAHDIRYQLNLSKVRKHIKWKPKISFNSGIRKTVNWYMQNLDWLKLNKKKIGVKSRIGLSL